MFFEKDLLSFHLLDVLRLDQTNVRSQNSGRNFNALSFRFCSDATLTTESRAYPMQSNSICYVPARLDYNREATVDEMIVVHFDTIDYTTREIEAFLPKDPSTLSNLFLRIFECWEKKEEGYLFECSAILYRIFAACYLQNFTATHQASKIQKSVDFLLANYKNSRLSIKEIADQSFMSEVYFRKLFKEEYGISPQKHIIHLRMQHAAGLISTGYYSLKEIADLSGYEDYKYFSVEFKKVFGVSPSEYHYNYHA